MRGNHDNTRLETYLRLEPQVEQLGVGRFNRSFISACEDSTRFFLAWYVRIFLNPIIHFFKDLGGRGASPRITALLPATLPTRTLGVNLKFLPKTCRFFFGQNSKHGKLGDKLEHRWQRTGVYNFTAKRARRGVRYY